MKRITKEWLESLDIAYKYFKQGANIIIYVPVQVNEKKESLIEFYWDDKAKELELLVCDEWGNDETQAVYEFQHDFIRAYSVLSGETPRVKGSKDFFNINTFKVSKWLENQGKLTDENEKLLQDFYDYVIMGLTESKQL